MLTNARVFVIVALVTCVMCARTADNRDSYNSDKRYGGSMLAEIAKELVQRSTTSSQVIKIIQLYKAT